ncbi:type IV toxin-antitoxin system AbiEi family antitoxin [Kangiella sp.]|uniref:type IV toxin-antitoxin system AbiEi family antitoxin n=1 Tax=Kangiella sp. TaxID=1920245 RepID=UPI003A8E5F0B
MHTSILLKEAIKALEETLEVEIISSASQPDLCIRSPNGEITLHVEEKKWVNHIPVTSIVKQLKSSNNMNLRNTLLVTDYVNANQAKRLKSEGVQYIDTAGNAYIDSPPIYLNIQGKRPVKLHKVEQLNKQIGKAFMPKGMQVIYMLLSRPDLVRASLRTIAEEAEIALGTVKQVMDDLTYQGFIVQMGRGERELDRVDALRDYWVSYYPANIHAKQASQLLVARDITTIKDTNIRDFNAIWGGEVAAELYQHHLRAKDATIYIAEKEKAGLIKELRLRKPSPHEDIDYSVRLVTPFIEISKLTGEQPDLAHPLLVYANLVATHDPRNLEAAERLYEQYLD